MDVWGKLSAPLPRDVILWRQDGKPILRDTKFFARFVAYIDASFVRERLDLVVPGEWDLTLELYPPMPTSEGEDPVCAFKARLQILGVIREDVGQGRDYKQAATDAFKRAAVRFGIGHELYGFEQNWVEVDGDGKYPRPVEDPNDAYARRQARAAARRHQSRPAQTPNDRPAASPVPGKQAKGRVQDALPPTKNGKPWSNDLDPNVQYKGGSWFIKGIDVDKMSDDEVESMKKTATMKGYQALVEYCNNLLARRALGDE